MFSPHYFRERQEAGAGAVDPLRHCGINVAVYGRGQGLWVLSEYGRRDVEREAEAMAVGGSWIGWEGDALVVRFDERTAVGGRRVSGEVRLRPSATFDAPVRLDGRGRHVWWGVAPHARVEVELRRPGALRFTGAGYHDTNFGAEPLEEGFAAWQWARVSGAGRTAVIYDAQRRDGTALRLGRVFGADGSLGECEAPREVRLGRTRWWVPRSTRCDAGGDARVVRTLEDTPFYARSEIAADLAGARTVGVHEALSLDRFVRPVVQRMLGYRIRRVT